MAKSERRKKNGKEIAIDIDKYNLRVRRFVQSSDKVFEHFEFGCKWSDIPIGILDRMMEAYERMVVSKKQKEKAFTAPSITKLTLLDEPFEDGRFEGRRYWFARWCHRNRYIHAPSGNTWKEVFNLKEGVSLDDYIKFAKENKLGEKYVQNRSRRENIQAKVCIKSV